MTTPHIEKLNFQKVQSISTLNKIFLPLFGLSTFLLLWGLKYNSERVLFNYLLSFSFLMSIGLSGLFFTMLQYVTGSSWSVVIRRIPESFTHLLPLGFLLALPIFFGLDLLYYWTTLQDHAMTHKAAYLNKPFFIVRTFLYFSIWTFLYIKVVRPSFHQDSKTTFQEAMTITNQATKWSSIGLVLFALSLTFAAVDWLMSLRAHWFSTIYGVYFFSGSIVCGLSLIIVVCLLLQKYGYLNVVTENHYHDLGKLLFGLNVFWTYIAFSQFMLIWYANLPEETMIFTDRGSSEWKAVSAWLVIGHFVIPFFWLMSRHAKRNTKILLMGALWLLAMHYIDLFWIIMPNFSKDTIFFGWIELVSIVWFISIAALVLARSFYNYNLIPLHDPRLKESLEFHQ